MGLLLLSGGRTSNGTSEHHLLRIFPDLVNQRPVAVAVAVALTHVCLSPALSRLSVIFALQMMLEMPSIVQVSVTGLSVVWPC
jgi:hypothetical protein